jgi:hypothetical protein
MHVRGISRHLRQAKLFDVISERYFLPQLKRDVGKFVQHYFIFQIAKRQF